MNIHANYLILMILITCSAFIGAINSRGTAKMIISYILAFVCLASTAFYVTQYAMEASQKRTAALTMNAQSIENKLDALEEKELALEEERKRAESESESEAASEVEAYKNSVISILTSARSISGQLVSFKVEAESDEEYETLQGKAVSYHSQAGQLKRKASALKAPDELRAGHEALMSGLDYLISSAHNLRSYYKAEDSAEEYELSSAFRSKARKAHSLLGRAQTSLQ